MDGLINSCLNTHWDRWKAPWMKKCFDGLLTEWKDNHGYLIGWITMDTWLNGQMDV